MNDNPDSRPDPIPEYPFPEEIDVVVTGPGDTTVRPLTGARLAASKALLEQIRRASAGIEEPPEETGK